MMFDTSNLVPSPELISLESDIYRRQKILFVLIDILFTFNLMILIAYLHLYTVDSTINENLKFSYPLLWIISSTIYYIFGLIIAYLCHRTGLRMFVWIGMIFLVLKCFIFALILILPLHIKLRSSTQHNFYPPRYIIFILLWICISILLLISVRLAFKLSKLITDLQHEVKRPELLHEI